MLLLASIVNVFTAFLLWSGGVCRGGDPIHHSGRRNMQEKSDELWLKCLFWMSCSKACSALVCEQVARCWMVPSLPVRSAHQAAEELLLTVPIHLPRDGAQLFLGHTFLAGHSSRQQQHRFLNRRRQIRQRHNLRQARAAHMPRLRQARVVGS